MNFTMQRNHTVVSRTGRAIEFVKGVPTHVPEMCWTECQAQGAVPDDELPSIDPSLPVVPQGPARAAAIAEAIRVLVLRAARGDFTASGSPSPAALSQIAGFPIEARERDTAWTLARTED